MLDSIRIVLMAISMAVLLVAIATSLTLRRGQRLTLAAIVGAWIGVAVALSAAGVFAKVPIGALAVLSLFGTPLIAAALFASFSPAFRTAVLGLPTPLLIGLNVIRILGVLMVLEAITGRMSGPFPYSAGWGDFITGVFALPVAWLAARTTKGDRWVAAWNAFGMLDLIVAVSLGILSANGSPIQVIHAGIGSAAMATLPWSLIPTVLVPYFLFSHALVFAQLRARARNLGTARRQVMAPNVQAAAARRVPAA
ncbi:MAG TPA: hypothetical protein VF118_08480 [Gemmatimonadaceae bacterium]